MQSNILKKIVTEREPMVTAKTVIESGLFEWSAGYLLDMAKRGLVPAYLQPGKGNKKHYRFIISELYDFLTKNRTMTNGCNSIQKRPQVLAGGLSGRWT